METDLRNNYVSKKDRDNGYDFTVRYCICCNDNYSVFRKMNGGAFKNIIACSKCGHAVIENSSEMTLENFLLLPLTHENVAHFRKFCKEHKIDENSDVVRMVNKQLENWGYVEE